MKRSLLHPVRTFRLHRLDVLRERLPLADPDRHALDTVADARFAALAPGFEPPIEWGDRPVSLRRRKVTDVPSGGAS